MKRVFLIVLDSFGIGCMPDAYKFGDNDCNTLKRISASKYFCAQTMQKMGLGNIDGVDCVSKESNPIGAYAKMAEKSAGKDTTLGHWEIAGIISDKPLPIFPDGFPDSVIDEFTSRTGKGVLCNKSYSGTEVIKDYGNEHILTGNLIVYTSSDSVFQIAAHEDVVPIEQLYEYCKTAREILTREYAVGRVIARPFTGKFPNFERTSNRHDFSLKPFAPTLLDRLKENGKTVHAIGKISDIFANQGVTSKTFTVSNLDGMLKTEQVIDMNFEGLCFTNLVDFDSKYGHRQDIDGYAKAITEFDKWLGGFIKKLKNTDILMITADHGCDPGDDSTNHTREYTPLLIYGKGIKSVDLGVRSTFADIAASIAEYFEVDFKCDGNSFMKTVCGD